MRLGPHYSFLVTFQVIVRHYTIDELCEPTILIY